MERFEVNLLDTHAVLWFFTSNIKLGSAALKLISACDRNNPFHVSSITAWEIALLIQKGRIDLGVPAKEWFSKVQKHSAWRSVAIDNDIALESINLPGEFHNDPADRFLVATARIHGLTLLTADRAILDYSKAGHLKAFDASL